ncbi:MAG TPA: protocatechuate 3,4-dioxygenase subunit alpha [Micromonosporaceae bacterium]|jgi:protocatechuate 3,4-dioxygenase alpha subunit|nr:protocatechuate 3,4-dioxygenase subunit alpha [Micromonosporaceae bacterium]
MGTELTPSQTVGPFFSHCLPWTDGPAVVPASTPGAWWLRGRVLDGAGEPVPDALVETWQADPAGHFDHPEDITGTAFRGFGRCPTDAQGRYAIRTVKPGPVTDHNGHPQAPHLDVSVFARGLLDRVVTRVYFADEEQANDSDPVLARIAEPRRGSLLAKQSDDGYAFDIRLQGTDETVFFAV